MPAYNIFHKIKMSKSVKMTQCSVFIFTVESFDILSFFLSPPTSGEDETKTS